jgi:hypothetical protein
MTRNVGLELAIAFAWSRWNAACQVAFRENITKGEVSEEAIAQVEAFENTYNELVAVRSEIAQYGLSSSPSSM